MQPQLRSGLRHQIIIAHRGATNGKHQISLLAQGENLCQGTHPVAGNRQNARLCACFLQHGGQAIAVGRDDLVVAGGIAGLHQLIARRDQGHCWSAGHPGARDIHSGQKRDILRGQAPWGAQPIAFGEIAARWAQIGRVIWTCNKRNFSVFCSDILLDEDMICALRHWRAGEDPGCLACGNGI